MKVVQLKTAMSVVHVRIKKWKKRCVKRQCIKKAKVVEKCVPRPVGRPKPSVVPSFIE